MFYLKTVLKEAGVKTVREIDFGVILPDGKQLSLSDLTRSLKLIMSPDEIVELEATVYPSEIDMEKLTASFRSVFPTYEVARIDFVCVDNSVIRLDRSGTVKVTTSGKE